MKVEFNVKYGRNVIEIPITEKTVPKFQKNGMSNLFSKKVTIYNDLPFDGVNLRRFDRFVIDKCNIQNGVLQNANGTIEKVANALTITTKDIEHYKPYREYTMLPVDVKKQYFTVRPNDFVVLDEVDDIVTNADEWDKLQKKYKDNGFSVTAVNEYINGMAVDNVQIIHT